MASIAEALSLQEIADVSAYYERQARPGVKGIKTARATAELRSCIACHDPGKWDAPRIAGQKSQYLEIQLSLFKQGIRTNDPNGVMQKAAKDLTPDEVRQISDSLGRQTR